MKIYLISVESVINSMSFLDEQREQVKSLNEKSNELLKEFNVRLVEYKRIIESKLIVNEGEKQKAYMDYQNDMQSTEASIQALKLKAAELTSRINETAQLHFDDAVNEWSKSAKWSESSLNEMEEYIIVPTESLIGYNTLPNSGTDVTEIIKSFVKEVVKEELDLQ